MSILIKGMEMPNDGKEWIMLLRVAKGEVELFDPIGEDESVFYKAVELPPHGRLIDADAFLAKTKEDPLFPLVERYGLSRVIEAQPTIIPAEEVPWHE